ncbi:MAG TPA: tRNA 2-thiocytidine(32) synthetase TtcA [Clostridia bacterium]|jgi:tRNA 2-thiocytidine biosynthesis protein TtcA|nr:tRNA 2-thiocytidine(32) synthetase TtcA [Clostridia bacterium]
MTPKSKHKNYSKWFLTKVKHAVIDFGMLEKGDKVAVGISGGKDSMALLYIMLLLKKWSNFQFDIYPITVDMGLNMDYSPIQEFCDKEGISYYIEPTQIGEIIFDVRQESNPCALCANLRRGALHGAALKLGCNKVALGHHVDDLIETFFLNLCFTGRFATFKPKTYLDRTNLWVIRPLIYLHEQTLSSLAVLEKLPTVENLCPASGKTKREDMKEIVTFLEERFPEIKERFLTALLKKENNELW